MDKKTIYSENNMWNIKTNFALFNLMIEYITIEYIKSARYTSELIYE